MKKSIFFSASALLLLSSCNKESKFESLGYYDVASIITPLKSQNPTYVTDNTYSIKMVNGEVEALGVTDLMLSGQNSSFTTGALTTKSISTSAGSLVNFSGNSGSVSSELPVTDIKGSITGIFNYIVNSVPGIVNIPISNYGPLFFLSYNLGDAYHVATFCPDSFFGGVTKLEYNEQGETMEYEDTDMFYRIKFNYNYTKADVVIYNAKFKPGQNVAFEYMVLKDLEASFSDGAYTLTADKIVPFTPATTGSVLNSEYSISNLKVSTGSSGLSGVQISYTLFNGEIKGKFDGVCAIVTI